MTAVFSPLGNVPLTRARVGDGLITQSRPHATALQMSYTITVSKYTIALPLTYTVERHTVAPLFVYYLVAPATNFAINGVGGIVQPDHVTYTLRPVAARTLIGGPLLQGIPVITWNYAVLKIDEFNTLIAFYQPLSPLIQLTYPDEKGTWQQRQAVMQPPNYGTRQTMLVFDVSFSFLLPFF